MPFFDSSKKERKRKFWSYSLFPIFLAFYVWKDAFDGIKEDIEWSETNVEEPMKCLGKKWLVKWSVLEQVLQRHCIMKKAKDHFHCNHLDTSDKGQYD